MWADAGLIRPPLPPDSRVVKTMSLPVNVMGLNTLVFNGAE
jgi:hypothetical protein